MPNAESNPALLYAKDRFVDRHVGPSTPEIDKMLAALGLRSLDQLVDETIPQSIRARAPLELDAPRTESEILAELRALADKNKVFRSYLGLGYHDCITPPVIRRNILENPGWYTQYTPYQAEIAQGRLEALLNFQTMVSDLTGLPVANASLLDEGTAAAEAMTLCKRVKEEKKDTANVFFVSDEVHPQTIDVVRTRAAPLGFEVVVGDAEKYDFAKPTFGILLQYPGTDGVLRDLSAVSNRAHEHKSMVVVATDLLALTVLRPPAAFGADVAVGNSQRFGVPLGFGGPHAAFMSTREELQRKLAGRIVGVSKDVRGRRALRLALQTREQHIRRERATSNICTAQVLLAVIASSYAVYHGPQGLQRIARRVHLMASTLAEVLQGLGCTLRHREYFDTIRISSGRLGAKDVVAALRLKQINVREMPGGDLCIALDETVGVQDLRDVASAFGAGSQPFDATAMAQKAKVEFAAVHHRDGAILQQPVFNLYHTEHELLRYLHRLESRDLSLNTSMISLGSCTMKLNATAEMEPISFPGFANLHPFAPAEQTQGYRTLFERLERWLAEITGFTAISLQPNAGAQGEYAGLLVIGAYHRSRGDRQRNLCLIPVSAHGTNPASAVLAGMEVLPVKCDAQGNIDVADLKQKAAENSRRLAALMVTYPSTHGVFEESIKDICRIVHENGGQVYLDGANMNALVGLCRPGEIGADVCHLNLHKTFCIPHGGGGPGMGPIGVAKHLAPFLPGHVLCKVGGEQAIGAVSSAPWGSALILAISYAYIAMMGGEGLGHATKVAILNANYVAHRLHPHFPVLYRGRGGRVAHECIIDLRPISKASSIGVDDVAKRLMDYGFHAPTMSFPVPGTLMIEPTESESLAELDRFCDALISIRGEIRDVEEGRVDAKSNLLTGAPHTMEDVVTDSWDRPYSRERAAFPTAASRHHKFWPYVGRIDAVYGDRHLVCCWIPEFEESAAARP